MAPSLRTALVLLALVASAAAGRDAFLNAASLGPASPPADQPPVPPVEPPTQPAEPPVSPAEPPVSPAEPPVSPAKPPVSPAEPPAESPVEPPVAPIEPTFVIKDDQFVRNGEPVQIISGSVHYFRIHPDQWEDRLTRAKTLGLNAIQTYIPWNLHNPQPLEYNFTGMADFERFVGLAQSLDLMVLLRLGPYICGEWDFGGLPAWLLSLPKVQIRSEDPVFLAEVDAWWNVLLPRVSPLLWSKGGPVVMVQVENEFGYYATAVGDKINATAYLTHLVNTTKTLLGNDTIVYTTDNADPLILGNGTLNGSEVYSVIDAPLGADYAAAFALQKSVNAPGQSPPFTSEFYSGWFSNWGEASPVPNATLAAAALTTILNLNASVNFYMAVGGTNFGFSSGANTGVSKTDYKPQITSYDYGAPIGEGGTTDSPYYQAIRDVISEFLNVTLPDAPELPEAAVPTDVTFNESASLFSSLDVLSVPTPSVWPKEMEMFNQTQGLILYTANLPATLKPTDSLTILGAKDRAHVWITTPAVPIFPVTPSTPDSSKAPISAPGPVRRLLGIAERWILSLKMPVAPAAPMPGDLVQILAENLGRVNFGLDMAKEKKGIGGVLIGPMPVFHWIVNPLPLDDISAIVYSSATVDPAASYEPTFFKTTFEVETSGDLFLNLKGWTKGYAWVNGFNLGRYWPVHGPQCHLYAPAPLINNGTNELVLLELDSPSPSLAISFLNGTDFSCTPVPLTPPAPVAGIYETVRQKLAFA